MNIKKRADLANEMALLMLSLVLLGASALAQMNGNVFGRVLLLGVNVDTPTGKFASGFTISVDGKQYLITAKHVVAALGDEGNVDIEQGGQWHKLKMKIYRCQDQIDIAVLIPPQQLTVNYLLPTEDESTTIGEDVYFVGFPLGFRSFTANLMGPYPYPLVKRGLLSGYQTMNVSGTSEDILLLDGYNNHGFSGGPVVVRDPTNKDLVYKVVGVISGFQPEMSPVMDPLAISSPDKASVKAKSEPWRIQKSGSGYVEYKDTDKMVFLNSGIVTAYFLKPEIDLIRSDHLVGAPEDSVTTPTLK